MAEWSIVDKVCLVTGANSGIGLETALELVKMGAAKVILACRNMETGKEAVEYSKTKANLSSEEATAKIALHHLDLSSLKSVRSFSNEIIASESHLDCLIANAGVFPGREKALTEDGFEMAFGTNHVGHFLLDEEKRSSQDCGCVIGTLHKNASKWVPH